jgi:hypothetical protein
MDEPRCPACGEPLYGWVKVASADGQSWVIDRCERCGLGVTRGVPDPGAVFESVRRGLGPGQTAEMRFPNRASLQAGIGGDRWAALELPTQRLHPTPWALRLLLGRHGLVATRVRQPPFGRNLAWMWQTLLNGFTFHTNFARDVIRGRLRPKAARSAAAFAVDALVSILAAVPIALVAVPLELAAATARRGGELEVSVAVPEASTAPLYDRSHGS